DHGPLSLKREIRELDTKMDKAIRLTAALHEDVTRVEDLVRDSETLKGRLFVELQDAERAMLNTDHNVRSLTADYDRAHQRLRLATSEIARLVEERGEVERALIDTEVSLTEVATLKTTIEEEIESRNRQSEELRTASDNLRRDLGDLQSQFAVLQERRSTVARELQTLREQAADLDRRKSQAELQIQQAGEQQEQTRTSIESLEVARRDLVTERD